MMRWKTPYLCLFIIWIVLAGCSNRETAKGTAQAAQATLSATQSAEPGPQTVNCTDLGGMWKKGVAVWRPERGAYDLSDCKRKSTINQFEIVKPAERNAQWKDALCNDGAPFAMRVRLSPSGNSKDWVIYLDDGGFCDDNMQDCAKRDPSLTTTLRAADRTLVEYQQGGIFSRNKTINPTFYDANVAIGSYCSSDLWSGGTKGRRPTNGSKDGWYFNGQFNVRSMFEILIQRYGLDDSDPQTKVLFAGSSAGAAGVEANSDTAAALVPNMARSQRLKLLADAFLVINYDDPTHRPGSASIPYTQALEVAYDFWNASHNSLCEAAQRQAGQHPGGCYISSTIYPYLAQPAPQGLGLPLLIQSSSLDQYLLELHHIDVANFPKQKAARAQWQQSALDSLKQFAWVFSGGDESYHQMLTNSDLMSYGPEGKTFSDVLSSFWSGGAAQQVIFVNP